MLCSFEGPWTTVPPPARPPRVRADRSRTISGGFGVGETPLPIPNRAVKPHSADGTWPSRARESRSPPVLHSRAALGRLVVVEGRAAQWGEGRTARVRDCIASPAPAGTRRIAGVAEHDAR